MDKFNPIINETMRESQVVAHWYSFQFTYFVYFVSRENEFLLICNSSCNPNPLANDNGNDDDSVEQIYLEIPMVAGSRIRISI